MADSFQKRQKERKRQEKQQAKQNQRLAAKASDVQTTENLATDNAENREDPDIAGIRPGPQPLGEQWHINDD